jgi:thimet oligopeptidase
MEHFPISIKTAKDIPNLFPKKPKEIEDRVQQAIQEAQQVVDKILDIPQGQRTFENTARTLDELENLSSLAITAYIISSLKNVSPDEAIRNTCQDYLLKISQFALENITNNKALYNALKDYAKTNAPKEALSDEEKYYLEKTLQDYKRRGLELPDEELRKVRDLENQITELSLKYDANIATDNRTIAVSHSELEGLDESFINNLKKDSKGLYLLGIDYPTYRSIMKYCAIESTRKALYHAYINRAYPANDSVLSEIINKRDELAKLLGFSSYAALNLDSTMIKKTEAASEFLYALLEKAAVKEAQEYTQLTEQLPASVHLNVDGKVKPWDVAYLTAWYEKKHYNLDDRRIAEYFPMEHTIEGLTNIYAQFFNLSFKTTPISGLWDKSVMLMSVYDRATEKLMGYLLLDLYPRANKFNHACQITIIPSISQDTPYLGIIIANYAPSTPDKPSLLKRDDVECFFHEFGHAIHSLLSKTKMGSFASANVKMDFLEVPSQMFEQWLLDKDILHKVSRHYKTGQPLPDEMINTIIKIKNLSSGYYVLTQGFYALLSLGYYSAPCTSLQGSMRNLYMSLPSHIKFEDDNHMYCSFGHLPGYGACYYSYLYSKVLALDIFSRIKTEGLLNPEAGAQIADIILRPGGSKEPMTMVKEFLGREPNQDAFLKDMGL